ncbi:hypothetical protein PAAG_04794 [Paracoccidioides lutzii Pb01]|uniref:Uncharacterized protein n=1 Tax=Paracoccidioides lutzii (strain ATCC MYA-826 / Pb01) TaxID=502779 RepID=C1H2G5_PARBA|nr:hypothetical protein PAAG_04794 [Paracoccidioides lutzii Pb01]EEH33745.2 hypothetical protein PAAG_04794 [Paracoccidioides lutzii Pb01]
MVPKICYFGAAIQLNGDSKGEGEGAGKGKFGIFPMQPDQLPRARGSSLVVAWISAPIYGISGQDDTRGHLAEMIALLGLPPNQLLAKSDAMAEYKWPDPTMNASGKICSNPREFFHGPSFNQGKFLHNDLIPVRKLEDSVPSLDERERELFLSFVRDMLQ